MKTLANINDNINIKFNKTMTTISENAESQQVAGNRAEEMMASAIAHEAKMAEIKAAEEQEEKMNLRIIKIKPAGNAKMFRTLAKAIAAGATTLIVTTRVDVAGCGYVWFGIRKGYTELDGKLLLNAQIWNYLMAFLMGKELPEVTEFEPDREICCQSEWLAECRRGGETDPDHLRGVQRERGGNRLPCQKVPLFQRQSRNACRGNGGHHRPAELNC